MTNIARSGKLNKGQQAAAEGFFQFLLSPTEKELKISGGGGTGKSHLVSHLIDEVMPRYQDTCDLLGMKPDFNDVEMTSLTNKASEVLSVFTGRHVSTIHSFMNLKVQDDYSTGQSKITKTNGWRIHEGIILFIDEYSMIDTALDRIIQEGTHNCKIVYVGDHLQMGPVMEASCPIDRPGRMRTYELTEDMRTQIPEIQALKAQLRETVSTGIFKPIQIVPGIIDHLDDAQMQLMLAQTFGKQTLDSRILAYTNKRVVAYNDYIRDVRGLPDEYTIGELLVNNSAIRLKNSMLSVEEEIEILSLGSEHEIPIENNVVFKIRHADLKTRVGGVFKDVPLPSDRAHYAALITHFRKAKNWPRYYELRNTYPDLRQRDSATVYKAQGSTYETAFVDLGDISTCHNPNQVARMLYVALSREKQRIFLFGQLAPKYGGLIY